MTAQPNQSLAHGLRVLHALCAAETPQGSRALARSLGMEHTRTNRLLGTLSGLGLASRGADRCYRPGPAIHVLAASALRGSGLLHAALPVINSWQGGGGDLALGVLWEDAVCYLWRGLPSTPIEQGLAAHALYPAAQSSIGVLLTALVQPTRRRLGTHDLAAVRTQGWVRVQPPSGGTGSLAVVVHGGDGAPVAGLALVDAPQPYRRTAAALAAAAQQISKRLAE